MLNDRSAFGRLDEMPRRDLAYLPTPVEFLPNLTREVGGAAIWVKRDDCTGLALGGNKIRQLEYYMGDALAQTADTILITGAVQSNFVRSAAAAAAKCGLKCHVQLEERVENPSQLYRTSGNVLLDRLFGAVVHTYPEGEDETGADRRLAEIAGELKAAGRKPYIIPLSPGHPPFGALGYVNASRELSGQLEKLDQTFNRMFVASGSGSTHGGLLFGLCALGVDTPLQGICVRRSTDLQHARIVNRAREIAEMLETDNPVEDRHVWVDDEMLAPGYGRMNDAVAEAIRLAARTEALIIDPVYTGRVFAAAIAYARRKSPDEAILIIHTGGTPAIFAYENELAGVLS